MTRAKKELYLSYTKGTKDAPGFASRFLTECGWREPKQKRGMQKVQGKTENLQPNVFLDNMIPGSKGQKADASLLAGGFLSVCPASGSRQAISIALQSKPLSLFQMTPSSRHESPCIYARNHSFRYESSSVYSRQHHAFSLGVLVFVPDSISMTGLKVSMILSSKPLVYS